MTGIFCARLEAPENLIGILEEEQGGAQLPDLLQTGAESHRVIGQHETALVHKGGEVDLAAGAEVFIQGGVEGGKTTAEKEAAVVAAAGEHGGIPGWQILPAGMVGNFPEDGIQ